MKISLNNNLKSMMLALVISLITSPGWSDNSLLSLRFTYELYRLNDENEIYIIDKPYNALKPCEEILDSMVVLKKPWNEMLLAEGIPNCKGYDFPAKWLDSKILINEYHTTECKLPCNVRQFPMVGSHGNIVGKIEGTNQIFIDYKVTTKHGLGFWEKTHPWYRHWYAFTFEDQTYYIWVDNIKK